jgi:hypothetical protein
MKARLLEKRYEKLFITEESLFPTEEMAMSANPKGAYPWAAKEAEYADYSTPNLFYARADAGKAWKVAEENARFYAEKYGPDSHGAQEWAQNAGYYADDVGTIVNEMRRRECGPWSKAPNPHRSGGSRCLHGESAHPPMGEFGSGQYIPEPGDTCPDCGAVFVRLPGPGYTWKEPFSRNPYQKVRYKGPAGATAGLVFEIDQLDDLLARGGHSELSRRWEGVGEEPGKFHRVEMSPEFDTWKGAFEHDFAGSAQWNPRRMVKPPKLPTYREARKAVWRAFGDRGWTLSSPSLKVIHATSPYMGTKIRLWFKAQAMLVEYGGPPWKLGDARTFAYDLDLRRVKYPSAFAGAVEQRLENRRSNAPKGRRHRPRSKQRRSRNPKVGRHFYTAPTDTADEVRGHLETVTLPRIAELTRIKTAHISAYPKNKRRQAEHDYLIMNRRWADEWWSLEAEQRRLKAFLETQSPSRDNPCCANPRPHSHKRRKSKGARRGNPATKKPRVQTKGEDIGVEDAVGARGYEAARKAYRKFHGTEPTVATVYRVDDGKAGVERKVVMQLGHSPEVHYVIPEGQESPQKENTHWVHKTDKNAPPALLYDPQTKMNMLVGGAMKVEDWLYD